MDTTRFHPIGVCYHFLLPCLLAILLVGDANEGLTALFTTALIAGVNALPLYLVSEYPWRNTMLLAIVALELALIATLFAHAVSDTMQERAAFAARVGLPVQDPRIGYAYAMLTPLGRNACGSLQRLHELLTAANEEQARRKRELMFK